MTFYINLLSNIKISFDLKGNNPAASVLPGAATEEDGAEEERADRKLDSRRISNSPSSVTSVGVEPLEYPRWIAGVGDLAGADGSLAPTHETRRPGSVSLDFRRFTAHKSPKLSKDDGNQSSGGNGRTALQRHCDFWDTDGDGLIYPWDIYRGFSKLGFHFTLCLWAAITMAICASYNTHTSYIPHPLFAINLDNINSNRHGSSTGTYDMDGELDEMRFEAIFEKYAQGKDYLTMWSTYNVWRYQRCGLDFFGWFAGGLECRFLFAR